MPHHQSLARNPGRRSLPPRTPPDTLPTQRPDPPPRQKAHAHRSTHIHEPNIAPINRIPREHVPVNVPAYRIDAVEMANVRDEQAEEEGAPDPEVSGCAQDEGFVEGEAEIEVR